ncbi:MAG: HAMP domain-containing histidine kinase, partial [Ekhidna sp.]|nr:HAMP domain-containing histidine kinase [Ekhidna sp.]
MANLGSLSEQPHSFENKRILLLNKIALVAVLITSSIVLTHVIIGNVVQPIVVSSGYLIAIPTLWFQSYSKYKLARNWFLLGFFLVVSVIFFHSVNLDLATSTEYVLVIFIPMTLLFLDGRFSVSSTIIVIVTGMFFIAFRYYSNEEANIKKLYGLEINWLTICFAVFFCVVFFKRSLIYAIDVLEEDKEKLTEADHTKNFLFGIISHDIRSPLSTLKQYLLLDPSLRQDQEQFMIYQQGLVTKIDQISNTLNDLLYWSKAQLQGIKTQPSSFYLSEIVESIMPILGEVLRIKRIEFVVNDKQEDKIWCDKDHLTVILRNLLQNAIKFTGEEGSLTLSYQSDQNWTTISVVDNGEGMDEKTLASLQQGMIVQSHLGTSGEVGTGL